MTSFSSFFFLGEDHCRDLQATLSVRVFVARNGIVCVFVFVIVCVCACARKCMSLCVCMFVNAYFPGFFINHWPNTECA